MYKGIVTIYLGILKSFAQFTMSSNSQALKPWMGKWSPAATPGGGFPGKRGPCTGCGCGEKKQLYRKAWICGFVHLEEVPLKSADQRDGGVRKEPVDKGEVHLEIPFCTLFWI